MNLARKMKRKGLKMGRVRQAGIVVPAISHREFWLALDAFDWNRWEFDEGPEWPEGTMPWIGAHIQAGLHRSGVIKP